MAFGRAPCRAGNQEPGARSRAVNDPARGPAANRPRGRGEQPSPPIPLSRNCPGEGERGRGGGYVQACCVRQGNGGQAGCRAVNDPARGPAANRPRGRDTLSDRVVQSSGQRMRKLRGSHCRAVNDPARRPAADRPRGRDSPNLTSRPASPGGKGEVEADTPSPSPLGRGRGSRRPGREGPGRQGLRHSVLADGRACGPARRLKSAAECTMSPAGTHGTRVLASRKGPLHVAGSSSGILAGSE